jgi:class 3 adenylate cyclase
MPPENVERKLTAILRADVKGYSRLMGEDEVGTLRMLRTYREVTDALIQHHRGRIVGTAGDSILVEFASAVEAVQCAVEVQQALKTRNADLPSERRAAYTSLAATHWRRRLKLKGQKFCDSVPISLWSSPDRGSPSKSRRKQNATLLPCAKRG